MGKLSDAKLRALKAAGKVQKLADGGGLYIHVTAKGSRLWRLAYSFEGKQKTLVIGAYPAVSLAGAALLSWAAMQHKMHNGQRPAHCDPAHGLRQV